MRVTTFSHTIYDQNYLVKNADNEYINKLKANKNFKDFHSYIFDQGELSVYLLNIDDNDYPEVLDGNEEVVYLITKGA